MSCVSDALRREAKVQKDKAHGYPNGTVTKEIHLEMWAMLERLAHDIEHPKVREPSHSGVESSSEPA